MQTSLRGLPLRERLHRQSKATENGCWVWIGSRDKDGYGYVKQEGITTKAHRASYSAFVGPIPDGLWVLHKCNNPSCINPEHLYAGTAQQNSDDREASGNSSGWKHPHCHKGEGNPNSRLTKEDVEYIRRVYKWGMGPKLSKQFGVGPHAIYRVVKEQAWT